MARKADVLLAAPVVPGELSTKVAKPGSLADEIDRQS